MRILFDSRWIAPHGIGEQIDQDGISYVILHEDQILARVESLQESAA